MPQSPHLANSSTIRRDATDTSKKGFWVIALLVIVLLILHQDNWLWTDGRLLFGFMPIGLAWHAGISIGASLTWLLATKIAWPVEPEFATKVADVTPTTDEQEAVK